MDTHCANCGADAPVGTPHPAPRQVWLCRSCDREVALTLNKEGT